MLRFPDVDTVKHYAALGAYFGFFAAVVALVRALPALPEKLRESASMPWWDIPLGLLGLVAFFAAFVLLGGLVGGFVYWVKRYSEKRARAGNEALIPRR